MGQYYPDLQHVIGSSKMGYNGTLDSAPEDLWDAGALYAFPAAVAATTIESSSSSDAAAGTGARTVFVDGLDANYAVLSETATLNGATPVTLANQYLRINRIRMVTAGSGQTNAGTILVKQGSTVIGSIAIGVGQDRMAIYTTSASFPVTKIVQVLGAIARQTTACTAELQLYTRALNEGWRARYELDLVNTGNGLFSIKPLVPIQLAAKTDIRLTCTNSSASAIITGGFELIHYASTGDL